MSLNPSTNGSQEQEQEQEITVTLRRHPTMGFGWVVSPEVAYDGCTNVIGFDTLQEMISSIDFIQMLQKNLGTDSVPENVVKYAQWLEGRNTVNIDDALLSEIKERFGGLNVIDSKAPKSGKEKQ